MKKITFLRFAALFVFMILINIKSFSQDIVVSEINYHADSTRDAGSWIELYNRGTAAVDITNWVFSDADPAHFFIIPGKVLNPGEYAVLVQDQTQFATQYPGLANVLPGSFVFGLSNRTDSIRLFDASNALEFSMAYADSMDWPKTADGHGRTLEVRNVFGNFSDQYNWYAGCMMGSPGTAPMPCTEPIVFSEVNYHSSSTFDVGDWVELNNTSALSVDLSNWVFRDKYDSVSYVIPSGTIIPPGAYRVFAHDLVKFNSEFSSVAAAGPFSFNLINSKDILRLYNNAGVIQYSLQYNDSYPWPVDADGGGYTLELIDPSAIVNDGNDWKIGCLGGSPGTYYNAGCFVGLTEKNQSEFSSSVYPNPFSNDAILEIRQGSPVSETSVELYNMLGEKIQTLDKNKAISTTSGIVYRLSGSGLESGIYFYKINVQNKIISSGKFIINK